VCRRLGRGLIGILEEGGFEVVVGGFCDWNGIYGQVNGEGFVFVAQ